MGFEAQHTQSRSVVHGTSISNHTQLRQNTRPTEPDYVSERRQDGNPHGNPEGPSVYSADSLKKNKEAHRELLQRTSQTRGSMEGQFRELL